MRLALILMALAALAVLMISINAEAGGIVVGCWVLIFAVVFLWKVHVLRKEEV